MNTLRTIRIMDITDDTATNIGGLPVYLATNKLLELNHKVCWDLDTVSFLSSSFLNSSVGELIDKYGIDFFKSHFSITKYSRYQVEAIKDYIEKYEHLTYRD